MDDMRNARPICQAPTFDAGEQCAECGVFGAFRMGDIDLCTDCYASKGSCCPEFGKDDLWRDGISGGS